MKRKGYRFGVEWIALNDSAADGAHRPSIKGYISTALLADLFGKTLDQVAEDVAKNREQGEIGTDAAWEKHES